MLPVFSDQCRASFAVHLLPEVQMPAGVRFGEQSETDSLSPRFGTNEHKEVAGVFQFGIAVNEVVEDAEQPTGVIPEQERFDSIILDTILTLAVHICAQDCLSGA